MTDYRTELKHDLDRVGPARFTFEDVTRRRDRKRRNQRITAGVVGIAVFVAAVWIVTTGLPFDRTQTEVVPGGAATASDPFVSIQGQLDEQAAKDLFEVVAEDGTYWRTLSLDLFDGTSFFSSDPLSQEGALVYTPPAELPPAAGEAVPDEDAPRRSYVFRILDGTEAPWLPLPQRTESLNLALDQIRYDPFDGQVVVDGGLDEGLEYSVKAPWVAPTPAQLDASSREMLTPDQYGLWTSLPGSLDPRIAQIARAWTEDEPNAYRKVLAIQRRFQREFTYSTSVKPATDTDALVQFLTQTKTGFCQQFAPAMAVMVRTLGYPARVAVGYQAGTETEDGTFLVKTSDAHAWVEVLFPDYGWLPFEPTPGRGIRPATVQGSYLNPVAPPVAQEAAS